MTDQLPADWAIEHALEASVPTARSDVWTLKHTKSEYAEGMAWAFTVIELARMIEKYEPHLAPVNPDVLAVREILAAYENAGDGTPRIAQQLSAGERDQNIEFKAALRNYRDAVAARG
jgi:hypothetical protein